MELAAVGLIGGTGIGERLASLGGKTVHVPTSFGLMRGLIAQINGRSVCIVSRHAKGHRLPPHRVPYQAIAVGLSRIGVKNCVSTAAVGSLNIDWPAGTIASCTDMIDMSGRNQTLFDREVKHTDFTNAFPLSNRIKGVDREKCTYVCMNGPRYESQAEIKMLKEMGGDVVGMTAASEAIAMREAGIHYGCVAIVTNLGCGLEDVSLDHGDVSKLMHNNSERVIEILINTIENCS